MVLMQLASKCTVVMNVGASLFYVRPKVQFRMRKKLIDRLLLERMPLAGISRTVEVSESWLQDYVNKKYENEPRTVNINSISIQYQSVH